MWTTINKNVFEQTEVMEHFNSFHFALFWQQMPVVEHHSMTSCINYLGGTTIKNEGWGGGVIKRKSPLCKEPFWLAHYKPLLKHLLFPKLKKLIEFVVFLKLQ